MGIVYMKDILDAISESTRENAEIYFPDALYYWIDGVESEDWHETET